MKLNRKKFLAFLILSSFFLETVSLKAYFFGEESLSLLRHKTARTFSPSKKISGKKKKHSSKKKEKKSLKKKSLTKKKKALGSKKKKSLTKKKKALGPKKKKSLTKKKKALGSKKKKSLTKKKKALGSKKKKKDLRSKKKVLVVKEASPTKKERSKRKKTKTYSFTEFDVMPFSGPRTFGDKLYLVPTLGDGNCFFHSVLTRPGQNRRQVIEESIELRRRFADEIRRKDSLTEYTAMVAAHFLFIYMTELEKEVPDYSELPRNILDFFNSRPRDSLYDLEPLYAAITQDNIRSYLLTFERNGVYIATTHDMGFSPADAIALLMKRRINIFWITRGRLQFHKMAGNEGPIINVLLDGLHYSRLYDPTRETPRDVIQIAKNADF